jgi:drug/metabolite transporter (DMT)-like permease
MPTKNNAHFKGILLLILIALISATTVPLTKDIVSSLSPSVLISTRFLIAAMVFSVHLRNLNLQLLRDGMVLGGVLFTYLAIESIALKTIPASRAVFIVSLNTLIVPLLGWFSGQRVTLRTFLAAGFAITGIGLMFWKKGGVGMGDFLMFGDALIYAGYLLFLERIADRHPTASLTAVQVMLIGGLGVIWSNQEIVHQFAEVEHHWQAIVYLAVVATTAVTWVQSLAQRWVSAHEVALIYTLEPIFSAIFSFWLLGERLGIGGLIGATFVLVGLVISQTAQIPEVESELQAG